MSLAMPNHDASQLGDTTFAEVWKEYMIDEIETLSNDGGEEPAFTQQLDSELRSTCEDERATRRANDRLDPTLWSHLTPLESSFLPVPGDTYGASPYVNTPAELDNGASEMAAFTSLPALTAEMFEVQAHQSWLELSRVWSESEKVAASTVASLRANISGSASRLPTEAVSILQDWLIRHHLNPYPNGKEKSQLADSTGLSVRQVNCWFNRTRSRKMQTQNLPKSGATASLTGSKSPPSTNEDQGKADRYFRRSECILIPSSKNSSGGSQDAACEREGVNDASPMQRFLSTPPEADAAPLEAIKRAAATNSWKYSERSPEPRHFRSKSNSTASSSSVENHITRYDAPRTDRGYDSVSLSNGSSQGSAASHASHASWSGRQGRKRHQVSVDEVREHRDPQRRFTCTWCKKSFKRVYEWQRHEESQHVPQTEFVCLKSIPKGKCAFCQFGTQTPNIDLETLRRHYVKFHNAELCLSKSSETKAFDRKDHLVQHIRQVHARTYDLHIDYRVLDDWQQPIQNSAPEHGWTCGFCHENFKVWIERVSHVKDHFKSGLGIQDWTLHPSALALSRPSRTSFKHPCQGVWGCESCLRSFKSFKQLQEHEALPHLHRSIWTCADLLTRAIFHGDACSTCAEPREITFLSNRMIRRYLFQHWGIRHGLAYCKKVFPTLSDFKCHAQAVHCPEKLEELDFETARPKDTIESLEDFWPADLVTPPS